MEGLNTGKWDCHVGFSPLQGRHGHIEDWKALGIGTGTVRRVVMEQPRPFDVGVPEAAFASQ